MFKSKRRFIFSLLTLLVISVSLKADLTPEEQQRIIAEHQCPEDIQARLDNLFNDPARFDQLTIYHTGPDRFGRSILKNSTSIKQIFTEERYKPYLASHTDQHLLQEQDVNEILRTKFVSYHNYNEQRWINLERVNHAIQNVFPQISNRHNVTIHSEYNTWILQFNDMPEYIIKISKFIWPSKYQNISRILYNDKITLLSQNAPHIRPLRKWLYHIPGQPEELNDENYIVISEYIQLPSKEENKTIFETLQFNRKEHLNLISQIRSTIVLTGLYACDPGNIFLIEEDGILKAVFTDTQQDGISGSITDPIYNDSTFYLKNEAGIERRKRCAQCGLDGLKMILSENNVAILKTICPTFFTDASGISPDLSILYEAIEQN